MEILKYLFRRARTRVFIATLAGILSGICHVALLSLVSRAAAQGRLATALIGAYAGMALLLPFTRVFSQILLSQISQDAIFDVRLRLCRQILGAPLRALEVTGIPRLLSSLTDDVMVIGSAFTIFPILCTHATVLIACLAYLGHLSWRALLLTLLTLVLGIFGFRWLMGKAIKALTKARASQNDMLNHFQALTEGIKELKLHQKRRSTFISNILNLTASEFRKQNITGVGYYASAGGWGQLLQFTLFGVLAFLLPRIGWINHEALVTALLVLLYINSPIDILSSNLPTLGRAKVALDAIEKLGLSLEERSNEHEAQGRLPKHHWQTLQLSGVTHTYRREGESSDFLLGPVDLIFRPGELVFLIGGNGSGKTTLAKLIAGLYAPESGSVSVDHEHISDATRDDYRQLFSMVFSDFFLFESLIGLDSPELDRHAERYLKTLRLDTNVQVKDGKLSTLSLSQGQRKRLALLTAYLEDRPIYIFDEWAADQDPTFKQVFYYSLLPELKSRGKTVIVISHDDAFYHVADRIIKLNYGQLEYDGPVGEAPVFAWGQQHLASAGQ